MIGAVDARIGTVVGSTVQGFAVQSNALNLAPHVGTLVRVRDDDLIIYGIVAGAETTSIDPGRQVFVRDGDAPDADTYLARNPHLAKLYRTQFAVLAIAHETDGGVRRYLPPRPVRIYSAVEACAADGVQRLFGAYPWTRLDLLPLLVAAGDGAMDDVVAAFIRHAASAMQPQREFLLAAGRELAVLLANNPVRLNALLRRIGQ